MAQNFPYVSPDFSRPVFAAPATSYSFHQPSHIFSGQNFRITEQPDVVDEGTCFIVAKFNYAGELEDGTIKVVGGIPSRGISVGSVLLQGSIVNVDNIDPDGDGDFFRCNFIFKIDQHHNLLQYDSHFGVWNAFMFIPGWPEHFYRYLFRRSWGPNDAMLNSYIGQVSKIV